ncbi:unnamed protein product [Vitrella brassicaformis CCMP3155]|uniref:Uncharacterized protein n=2 Tax=Vitrella brassicaformis TaxID=1169539 RepID=A0A0G4G365_VITBC|nr:unnamed protein product [Vitrella brassicaformis CCMP3155]|eukprot:CEM22546.1 unnamed protein product [Vitrella brassicaformis CCMP3155]
MPSAALVLLLASIHLIIGPISALRGVARRHHDARQTTQAAEARRVVANFEAELAAQVTDGLMDEWIPSKDQIEYNGQLGVDEVKQRLSSLVADTVKKSFERIKDKAQFEASSLESVLQDDQSVGQFGNSLSKWLSSYYEPSLRSVTSTLKQELNDPTTEISVLKAELLQPRKVVIASSPSAVRQSDGEKAASNKAKNSPSVGKMAATLKADASAASSSWWPAWPFYMPFSDMAGGSKSDKSSPDKKAAGGKLVAKKPETDGKLLKAAANTTDIPSKAALHANNASADQPIVGSLKTFGKPSPSHMHLINRANLTEQTGQHSRGTLETEGGFDIREGAGKGEDAMTAADAVREADKQLTWELARNAPHSVATSKANLISNNETWWGLSLAPLERVWSSVEEHTVAGLFHFNRSHTKETDAAVTDSNSTAPLSHAVQSNTTVNAPVLVAPSTRQTGDQGRVVSVPLPPFHQQPTQASWLSRVWTKLMWYFRHSGSSVWSRS